MYSRNGSCPYVPPLKSMRQTLALNLTKTQKSEQQAGNRQMVIHQSNGNTVPDYPVSKEVRRIWTILPDMARQLMVATVSRKELSLSQRPNPIDVCGAREQGECASSVELP